MASDIELSERELEILRLVATGASNKQIAQELFISANTVKVHLRNIFAKIGVVSRTEATLYAIREGVVFSPNASLAQADVKSEDLLAGPEDELVILPTVEKPRPIWRTALLAGLLIVVAIGLGSLALNRLAAPRSTDTPTPAPTQSRWDQRAPMPEGRAGMAAAVYENAIYAIGGETEQGVTGSAIRYDPEEDHWSTLAVKPVAVTDVGAVTIGGMIYVPGGKLASGVPTDVFEVYNPRSDTWERKADLPIPASSYAIATFEGKLYLFGGWDGTQTLDKVYSYEPGDDEWQEMTAMPTSRASAGAAVVGGKIYVIGGWDGEKALAVNEVYTPEEEGDESGPWIQTPGVQDMGSLLSVTNLAESIYGIFLGENQSQGNITNRIYLYHTSQNTWDMVDITPTQPGSRTILIGLGEKLYVLGGSGEAGYLDTAQSYLAIYKVVIPGVSK